MDLPFVAVPGGRLRQLLIVDPAPGSRPGGRARRGVLTALGPDPTIEAMGAPTASEQIDYEFSSPPFHLFLVLR
jgi:hypothetical protein